MNVIKPDLQPAITAKIKHSYLTDIICTSVAVKMRSCAFIAVLCLIQACTAHVSLVFPPSRKPTYDFLDNIRTGGPCGLPCK